VAAAVWAILALAGAACTATNFLDPEGPRYYESARPAKQSGADATGDPALRVVTFNIKYGRGIEGAIGILQATDALRNPDILLLQEMSSAGVARIAAGLGLNYLYFPSGIHPQAHQEFGTAILSPWPIEEPAKLVLPHGAAITGMRRAVTVATVRWRDVPVRVFSVHLPGPMSIDAAQRREQVERILDAAGRLPGPVIVGGDFNSRSVGPWFEQDRFLWLTKALPGTSRGPGFWLSYDHVFVRGLGAARATPAAGYVESAGVSDHRVVWVRLEPAAGSLDELRSAATCSISPRSCPRSCSRRASSSCCSS
jgi:vancomycin resistance protein VanJ